MNDKDFLAAANAAYAAQQKADSKTISTNTPDPDIKSLSPTDYAHQTAQKAIYDMQSQGNTPTIHDAVSLYSKALGDSQEYQKSLAQKDEERAHLTPEEAGQFGASRNAWDILDQIGQSFTQTTSKLGWAQGPIGGSAAGVMGAMGNPDVNAYNTLIHTARPILNAGIMHEGKAQAGEKANIQGFEANLPTLRDTPASAQAKLDVLRHMIANTTNTAVVAHAAAGRNLSGVMPLVAPIQQWDQAQQHPSQVGTPTAAGPVLNNVSPDARALLSKAFPQPTAPAQAASSPLPQTSPANQPVPAQPQQQSQVDPNWFSKIFGS